MVQARVGHHGESHNILVMTVASHTCFLRITTAGKNVFFRCTVTASLRSVKVLALCTVTVVSEGISTVYSHCGQ